LPGDDLEGWGRPRERDEAPEEPVGRAPAATRDRRPVPVTFHPQITNVSTGARLAQGRRECVGTATVTRTRVARAVVRGRSSRHHAQRPFPTSDNYLDSRPSCCAPFGS